MSSKLPIDLRKKGMEACRVNKWTLGSGMAEARAFLAHYGITAFGFGSARANVAE